MRVLLDTHVFLWYITNDGRSPPEAANAIREPSNEVYLRVVSVWEALVKHQLGKLSLDQDIALYPVSRIPGG